MTKRIREAQRTAEEVGLTVLSAEISGGKHIRLRCRRADGAERFFMAPFSPSDTYRAEKNRRAEMRRWAKGVEV